MKRLHKAAVIPSAALITVAIMASGPAAWAEESPDVTTHDEVSATQLDRAASAESSAEAAVADEFIQDQAAAGVLLDDSEVDAGIVGDAAVAWSQNVDPNKVEYASTESSDGDTNSEVALIANPSDEVVADQVQPTMGSGALRDLQGVASSWGGAVTARVAGNSVTNSWDLYRAREANVNPDVNYYYYGRYVVATGDQREDAVDEYPMDIDIRSRPTEGTADRVLTARRYYPFSGSSSCDSTSIGVSIAQFGATLPISNCKAVTVTPDGKALKVQFDAGNCHDNRSEGLDLGLTFNADADKARPAYSDYSWARFSSNKYGPCDMDASDDVRVIMKDPGR